MFKGKEGKGNVTNSFYTSIFRTDGYVFFKEVLYSNLKSHLK